MSYCTSCGSALTSSGCPNCATPAALSFASGAGAAAVAPARSREVAYPNADILTRLVAYFIDALVSVLILVIAAIPIVGQLVAGAALIAYWLLRDSSGASIGKRALGLRVVLKTDAPAPRQALIMRNSLFVIPAALLMIPLIGYFLSGVTNVLLGVSELLMMVTRRERLGDVIAGTKVIKAG